MAALDWHVAERWRVDLLVGIPGMARDRSRSVKTSILATGIGVAVDVWFSSGSNFALACASPFSESHYPIFADLAFDL